MIRGSICEDGNVRVGNGYANHSTTMLEGDELYAGTCEVLTLTEEFAVDLGALRKADLPL